VAVQKLAAGKGIKFILGDTKKPATLPTELNWANLFAVVRHHFNLEQNAVSLQYEYFTKAPDTYTMVPTSFLAI
jgi:hypothetical protein